MNDREEMLLNRAICELRRELDREICRTPVDNDKLIILSQKLDSLIAGYYQKKYLKVI
jgi:hypothetical protein